MKDARRLRHSLLFVALLALGGCSSKYMKVENPDALKENEEFNRRVRIEVPAGDAAVEKLPGADPAAPAKETASGKKSKKSKKEAISLKPAKRGKGKKASVDAESVAAVSTVHEPSDVEDSEGFVARRPLVDPFRVGETVVHDVHYFKVSAGTLTMRVDPFAQVNGRKAYNFVTTIQTYPTFSSLVYAADDKAVTLLDFDLLIPRVFSLHVKESGQLREGQSFFDFDKNEATYWEKKVTSKNGVEEKKQKWEILPFSQNVFSAIYYMRLFKWDTGKEYAFRVADDEQNLVFKGTALRREVLDTDLGPMKSIVVQPQISTKGIFKPMGEILIWLSDDDRKLVLRIESKIKIGTLVSEVISIKPGREP